MSEIELTEERCDIGGEISGVTDLLEASVHAAGECSDAGLRKSKESIGRGKSSDVRL